MPSSFPGGLDNWPTTRADSTSQGGTHATEHNNTNDAINKIEAELGLTPKATDASVAARLARMDTAALAALGITPQGSDASVAARLARIDKAITGVGRRRLDNSRGNDRRAMSAPPTYGVTTTVTAVNAANAANIPVGTTAGFVASGQVSVNGVAVSYTGLSAARTVTDGVLNSTTTVTSATAAFAATDVGKLVTGTGIPAGATIASVTNATTIVLSQAATATASGVSLTFGASFTGSGSHAAYVGGEVVVGYSLTSGIASGINWPSVSQGNSGLTNQLGDHFTYHAGGSPAIFGTVFPNYQYIAFNSLTYPGVATATYVASFYFDGTQLELQVKGLSGSLMIKVDDEYMSLTPIAVGTTGSTYFIPITFASRLVRRIDIIVSGVPWGGVMTGPTDTIVAAETRGPRTIVLSDSFTEGTGADAGTASNWTRTFADLMGWDDIWPSGVGGTGYLNPGTGGKVKFRDRVVHDVINYTPDIVVVAGGYNDFTYNPGSGVVSASQIGTEALTLFQQIVAALPSALLVVVSPWWRGGPATMPSALIAARDAIKASAALVGATFLDVLEMPLPSYLTPVTTTLQANSGAGASSVNLNAVIPVRSVLKIGNDRAEVKTVSGSGPFTHTLDGTLVSAHNAGDGVTQVGPTLWTGSGHVGATTGYGNADLLVGSDGTHPTQAGHNILGTTLARLLIRSGAI